MRIEDNANDNKENFMTFKEVLFLYSLFQDSGIEIWIDGGWAVDALLEKQLRPHKDLDIAIEWKDVPKLRKILSELRYKQIKEDNKWNFVLADEKGLEVDVHTFVYNQAGEVVDGIMYPAKSLTGVGKIEGNVVKCISAKYMVEFLSPWISKWPEKYLSAVFELCMKYGIELPNEYKDFEKKKR
jgi:lincosamide nucleotidyltransferase A/C/D/E